MSWDRHNRRTKSQAASVISKIQHGEEVSIPSERKRKLESDQEEDVPPMKSKKAFLKDIRSKLHARHFAKTLIVNSAAKGQTVLLESPIQRGELVCEYSGELITYNEGLKRENFYGERNGLAGKEMRCYMYYFAHGQTQYCIDATEDLPERGHGRLINHSCKGNLYPCKVVVDGLPRIVFIAKRDLKAMEELSYDYGERSESALTNFPWLSEA